MLRSTIRSLRPGVVSAVSSLLLAPAGPAQDVPYAALTNTTRSFTNFNVEVVRGMALTDATEMYAINAYQSTLLRFAPFSTLQSTWRTLNNPVSVATHEGDVYVVGQGNHALARHDGATGKILDVLSLPSEPADIVIDDQNDWAYVSCMGDDAVVRIQLAPGAGTTLMSILDIWSWDQGLKLKRPRFLYLDPNDPVDPADNVVYVAPLVSGNNTLVTRGLSDHLFNEAILDGEDTNLFPGGGLPDHDLFRIHPGASTEVIPVVRAAGSLILAHGWNPGTDDYWILNVDHLNAELEGEPDASGVFADNRLAIKDSLPPLTGPVLPPGPPDELIDIDDLAPPMQVMPVYDPDRSLPFPYAMEFLENGQAVIAGSMNRLFAVFDGSGDRIAEVPMTGTVSGSVPRTIRYVAPYLLVYCQQSSNICVYSVTPGNPPAILPFSQISLLDDPTPAAVHHGRGIWYDGTLSKDGRTSCNTCHPQGGADGLVWNIADLPVDDKGIMVTQPLFGIEDSFPYHWRGERALVDFNVIVELLGGDSNLPDEDMADFMEFIFSLSPAANPRQAGPLELLPSTPGVGPRLKRDLDRRLKDSLTPELQGEGLIASPEVGSPGAGSVAFHTLNSDDADAGGAAFGACVNCHTNPTGGNGDFNVDDFKRENRKNIIEVAHFDNNMKFKTQPIVGDIHVSLPSGTETIKSQILGSGATHNGRFVNAFDFVNFFFSSRFPAEVIADISAFLQLFDSGIAPSTHYAARLAGNSPPGTAANIQSWLLDQAADGWVDVVVVGDFPTMTGPVRVHWYYDPASQLFVPEDSTVIPSPQPFSAFQNFAGGADNVFMGVPPGNEVRLGVDWDNDGLDTEAEVLWGTNLWIADSDGDGEPDGYEAANNGDPTNVGIQANDTTPPSLVGSIVLDFVNASQAKFAFEADEEVTWKLEVLATPGTPPAESEGRSLDQRHTAVLRGLTPSTDFQDSNDPPTLPTPMTYAPLLVLTDRAGLSSSYWIDPFDTTAMIRFDDAQTDEASQELTVVGDITHTIPASGPFDHQIGVRIVYRERRPGTTSIDPAPEQIVVGQLLRKDMDGRWQKVPATDVVTNANVTARSLTAFEGGNLGHLETGESGIGPYTTGQFLVLAETNANGWRSFRFSVTTANPNDEFMFNVVQVVPKRLNPGYIAAQPFFDNRPFPAQAVYNAFHFPATKKSKRNIEFPY